VGRGAGARWMSHRGEHFRRKRASVKQQRVVVARGWMAIRRQRADEHHGHPGSKNGEAVMGNWLRERTRTAARCEWMTHRFSVRLKPADREGCLFEGRVLAQVAARGRL